MRHSIIIFGMMALCLILISVLSVYSPELLKNPVVYLGIMGVFMIGHLFMHKGHDHNHIEKEKEDDSNKSTSHH